MKIQGAIFDLDGTLLDSMYIWDSVGEDYLRGRGIEPREELRETFKAMSLKQAAEYFRSEYGLSDGTDEVEAGVNSMLERLYTDVVQPKEGAGELLAYLKKRGVKMCVATATDRRLTEAALRRCGLLGYFDNIFTCAEVGSGKDNAEIYEVALRYMGTPKERTVVFEDALHAARTAKSAGFPVVGVCDKSSRADEEAIRATADIYVLSLAEMRDRID